MYVFLINLIVSLRKTYRVSYIANYIQYYNYNNPQSERLNNLNNLKRDDKKKLSIKKHALLGI